MDLEHASSLFPFIFSIVATVVMIWPPTGKKRWVFAGASIVAGVFISTLMWMQTSAGQLTQNQLQKEVHGSDLVYFIVTPEDSDGNGKFELTALNPTNVPAFDVYLRIRSHVDLPMDTPEHQAKAIPYILHPEQIEIGNLRPGVKETKVFLEPGFYQIDIRTRYAMLTEMIKFGPYKGTIASSYTVGDLHGHEYRRLTGPSGYPAIYQGSDIR